MIPVMFFMFACGAKNDDGSGDSTTPPATNDSANQEQQQEIIPSLSNSDAFLMVFELVNDFNDNYENNDELKNTYLSVAESYVTVLKTVLEVEGLSSGTCFGGLDVNVADIDSNLNHVEKIMLSDNSTVENVDVQIQILFGYDAQNINLSYRYMYLKLGANKRTNEFEFNGYAENSIEKSAIDSNGSFEHCKITGVLGDEGNIDLIDVYLFDRNTKIEEVSINTINNNYIKNFEGCSYKKGEENVYYLSSVSDENMAKTTSHQSITARSIALVTVSQYRQIKYISALGKLQNASEKLVPLVNA